MIPDNVTANDELFELAWQAIETGSSAIVGYKPELRVKGREKDLPDASKFWARISRRTGTEGQSALSNSVTAPSHRRYTNIGVVFIQVFCPKSADEAFDIGTRFSELLKNAYRGKTTPGCIWFRNARVQELPDELEWIRFNVIVEYEYDEVG